MSFALPHRSARFLAPARSRHRHALGEFAGPLEHRIVPAFGDTGLLSSVAAEADPLAGVGAGPRLAAADTSESALLNGLLTTLTGSGSAVSLTAVSYETLANGDVNLGSLLGRLQTALGVGTPAAALTTNATLGQILTAAAGAAQADGATAVASAFTTSATALNGVAGGIQLGDLFQFALPNGAYAQAAVNALDLLAGGVQLFNYRNVATTTAPVTISGANLGPAGSVASSVALQARVVEPPVFVVGPAGSQFHSASVRLKLNVDLVDLTLDTSALAAPIRGVLGAAAVVNTSAVVGQLHLYADVARGSGVIQSISAITNAVTLQSTPAVADVYLGTISDAHFADRTRPLDPATDLTTGVVGTFAASATLLGVPVLNLNLGLTARAEAAGAMPTPVVTSYLPAFPKQDTVGSSAAVIGNLVTTLVGNLQVGVNGSLGPIALIAGTVTSVLTTQAATVLQPVLTNLLTNVADPALDALGVGIGEMDLIVLGQDSPDAPKANDDAAATVAGQPVVIAVRANDTVQTGTTATLTISAGPSHGAVTINANGTVTYTPAGGYVGADSFDYTLTDTYGRASTATVSITVGTRPNTPPAANPDVYTVPANTGTALAVLANDTDAEGDSLGVLAVTQPAHGTVAINPDGTVTYTPAAGFQGVDAFSYTAGDGFGGATAAAVSVTVGNGVGNTPPVVNVDAASTAVGVATAIDVLGNDTDADGDTLSVLAASQPAHGVVVVNANGTITYTPAAGYHGTDTFGYTAGDGFGGSGSATVTVTVGSGTNTNPVAVADLAPTAVNTALTLAVLGNDTDADGDPLSLLGVTQPAHGTAAANANGTVTYTPAAGFQGVDTFTYTLGDGLGGSAVGTVTVTVGNGGVNTPPVAAPDAAGTPAGTGVTVAVLANDSDPDGDPLAVFGVTQPLHGTAVLNADGTITYTPAAGFRGVDTFTYTAGDGAGGATAGTVTVTVGNATGNTLPTAAADAAMTAVNTPTTVAVLANDADPDGDPLTVIGVTQPLHGTVVVNPNRTITYTPAAGYFGPDSFGYTVGDGAGGAATATVTVQVGLTANAPPTAAADVASTVSGPVTIAVLANDTDEDGHPLSVLAVTQPAHGTAAINANGTVTYTPAAGFQGVDAFSYTAGDGFGGAAVATVTVTVGTGPNQLPVVAADLAATADHTPAVIDVLANDTDADGDTLAVVGLVQPAHGAVSVNPDGTLTYTPAAGFRGTDTFTYSAGDGRGGMGTGLVTVAVGVAGGNSGPVAVSDSVSTPTGVPVTVNVLANDTDADADPLGVLGVTQPAHGTVAVNPDGTVTYSPAAGYRGADAFTYTAADGFGGTAVGVVAVRVGNGVGNTSPFAQTDPVFTTVGLAVTVNVLANDTDADGDALSVLGVSQPAHGAVSVNPDGTLTYTPAAGFAGADTFTYTAADGVGGFDTGTVSVTVNEPSVPPASPPASPPVVPPTVPPVSPPVVPPVVVPPTVPPASPPVVPPTVPPVSPPVVPPVVPPAVPPTVPPVSPPAVPPSSEQQPTTPAPSPRGDDVVVVGADTTGGPRVTVRNADGTTRFNFFAYDPAGRFGVGVAHADLTGDGVPDLVTAPGVGGGPHVRVWDGVSLRELAGFMAFEPEFRGGVWLAAGDVDGDGRPDVVVGAGTGGGPRVRAFRADGTPLADVMAFDSDQRGGVRVAVADFDRDGRADVVATTGEGAVGRVRVLDLTGGRVLQDVPAFEPLFTGGVYVAAGDLTGDGVPDLVAGAGAGGGPRVVVYDGASGRAVEDRMVYEPTFTGGVRVAVTDVDQDGRPEVVAGPGPGGGPRAQGFELGEPARSDDFVFEDTFRGGIRVG